MGSGVRAEPAVGRSVGRDSAGAPLSQTGGSAAATGISATADANNSDEGFREIDCVRSRLSTRAIIAAEQRASRLGIGADRVLIAAGLIDEETYLRALGESIGMAFEPLDSIPRALCALDDQRLIEKASAGLLPLAIGDGVVIAIAPRATAARKLIGLVEDNPEMAVRFRLTTAEHFNRFVMRCAGNSLADRATHHLKRKWPLLSAGSSNKIRGFAVLGLLAATALAALSLAPFATALIFQVMLAALFVAWLGLRLTGALIPVPGEAPMAPTPDAALPVYTVIAALYREASSVRGLLAAIERLNYPAEKIDAILAVEADDKETRTAIAQAIAAARPRFPITVIPVPAAGPRTKPKALNVALPFARGAYTVVYDAEDRPEPDQLRRALGMFGASGPDLACVQARLCIDNTADSLLARYFTAEYAGQFDVFLPGFARMGLPLPLGGSSNHFPTATLREIGGWDPYNVTEDADLGIRLARLGYRSAMISSTTYEEAPVEAGPWLRQRTRWFKGWMQTWLVHMRQPRQLLGELGAVGVLGFQLIVGGSVLAALVHPLFLAALFFSLANGTTIWRSDTADLPIVVALYGLSAMIGYLSSAFIGWLGLARRGLSSTAWVLLLTPVHWLMLSFAAWRALYQLIAAPHVWEKTTHGLARNSHRAERMVRSLLELEGEIEALKKDGKLAVVGDVRRITGASSRISRPKDIAGAKRPGMSAGRS